MSTLDQLLIELYKSPHLASGRIFEDRDRRILSSLARQIISGNFLTENQGNLLVKIFKENLSKLTVTDARYELAVVNPSWTYPFRVVEQIRKIYLGKEGTNTFIIDFTFNKRLKQKIADLSKEVDGNLCLTSSRQYSLPLTEKNIYAVVKTFKNQNFEIDQKIMNFYHEISKFLENKDDPFDIFLTNDTKLLSKLENEIGTVVPENNLLLLDRKIRYQYNILREILEDTLSAKIANRKDSKIFINSRLVSLNEIISSLKELRRLPLLIIFDQYEVTESLNFLKNLNTAVQDSNISKLGIYFRFDSGVENAKEFNSLIGSLSFNQRLEADTEIVGIASGKLPKFMLKSDWYPKSVLNLQHSFKNNRTGVYCDAVDLIINYGETKPLGGDIDAIV